MKEYVPLPLVIEAKRLLQEEIRSTEGLNEPDFAGICICVCACVCCLNVCVSSVLIFGHVSDHFAKYISPRHFTLAEANSRGNMGGGMLVCVMWHSRCLSLAMIRPYVPFLTDQFLTNAYTGISSTNNGLERKNRTYKDDISYKMEQVLLYVHVLV